MDLFKLFGSKTRLVFGIEGSPLAVRVVPHRDGKKLMLKSATPEGGLTFLQLMGIPALSPAFRGDSHYCVEVSRELFLDNLGPFAARLLECGAATPERLPVAPEDAVGCAVCGTPTDQAKMEMTAGGLVCSACKPVLH